LGLAVSDAPDGVVGPKTVEVELVAVHTVVDASLLGDQSVLKKTLTIPDEAQWTRPEAGLTATVAVSIHDSSGVACDIEPFDFIVGDATYCTALECAVSQMRRGEVAEVLCKDGSLFLDDKLGCGPTTAKLVVTLKDFPEFKTGELTWEAKLTHCEKQKDAANTQVKAGKHAWALGKYRRIIALLDTRYSEIEDDLNAKVKEFRVKCKGNLCLCWHKLENWAELRQVCDDLLADCPHDVKALLRRGQALLELGEFAAAEADFRRVEPPTKESQRLILRAREEGKRAKSKQQAMFARMMQQPKEDAAHKAEPVAAANPAKPASQGEGDDGGSDWIFWAVLAALGVGLVAFALTKPKPK
jgi:hypothetical protein